MAEYTLGLFANMYPASDGDYRGIFIWQMVRDLEARGIAVKKAVKTSPSVTGYIPFLWQSLILARDASPDILQAEYIPHSSLIPALIRKRGVPLVLKFHGDDARIFPFRNSLNRGITTQMIRHADHIVTASEEIRQILIGFGADPVRITTIHTGVDLDFFSPGSRSEARAQLCLTGSETIFIFLGRLHPWKGIPEILSVAEACPDIRFILIGPGSVPPHPPNCTFTGPLVPEMVRTWLRAADCMVLPTHTEAVPTSVMEAFACGIPAITTDIGGCPEIVKDGVNGLMIPVRNAVRLRDAIGWMATHPDERATMGVQARQTVVARYDHSLLIEQLIGVHRSLI